MTINDKVKAKNLQYNVNRKGAKTSALSSEKIEKYDYLKGEKILRCNQRQVMQQAKFTYSRLGKCLVKQPRKVEDAAKY